MVHVWKSCPEIPVVRHSVQKGCDAVCKGQMEMVILTNITFLDAGRLKTNLTVELWILE